MNLHPVHGHVRRVPSRPIAPDIWRYVPRGVFGGLAIVGLLHLVWALLGW